MCRSRSSLVAVTLVAFVLSWLSPRGTALAIPPAGGMLVPNKFANRRMWPSTRPRPDPRCELLVPVNAVRIYSDKHSADEIAPRKYIYAQIDISNRLFRFNDREMAQYGSAKLAPCLQFELRGVFDVHEREVSELLGHKLDTEKVYGSVRGSNDSRRVGDTDDLRSLKVTDAEQYLTFYYVYDIKDPVDRGGPSAGIIGGESNVGFINRPFARKKGVLTKVSSVRADLGIVLSRAQPFWMVAPAHELGHYFGLFHAWVRNKNLACNIRDLGNGPQYDADQDPKTANVMDYEKKDKIHYFAKSQLRHMHSFATKDRVSAYVQVIRRKPASGSGTTPWTPPVSKAPAARFKRVWVAPASPGGQVVVHASFEADNLLEQQGQVVVWFADRSGQMLRDTDGRYRTRNGQVSVSGNFRPRFEKSTYNDYRLALPAGQLHLPPAKHDVSVIVGVFYAGRQLAQSTPAYFSYTVPGRPPEVQGGGRPAGGLKSAVVTPITIKGARWLRVRTKLWLDNLVGENVELQARFSFAGGVPLLDFDGKYRSAEGLVFAKNFVRPKYARSQVTNADVYIPCDQLHLKTGFHRLVANLALVYKGRTLASGATHALTLNWGGAPIPPASRSAQFRAVWITHNHHVGREFGMYVHVGLTVSGCRGLPVQLTAWFWGGDGRALLDFDKRYHSANGQASSQITVTPLYDVATFPDCRIFIPYEQLHLKYGTHDLGVTAGAFRDRTRLDKPKPMTRFKVTRRRTR